MILIMCACTYKYACSTHPRVFLDVHLRPTAHCRNTPYGFPPRNRYGPLHRECCSWRDYSMSASLAKCCFSFTLSWLLLLWLQPPKKKEMKEGNQIWKIHFSILNQEWHTHRRDAVMTSEWQFHEGTWQQTVTSMRRKKHLSKWLVAARAVSLVD